ncbi:hypothetical protein KSC_031470 [Ktedonobacter sp. SOSP1-52]|nr:hypothetical protein KSC_031470 [Ktedonobacter sp. SOSP1-52]
MKNRKALFATRNYKNVAQMCACEAGFQTVNGCAAHIGTYYQYCRGEGYAEATPYGIASRDKTFHSQYYDWENRRNGPSKIMAKITPLSASHNVIDLTSS